MPVRRPSSSSSVAAMTGRSAPTLAVVVVVVVVISLALRAVAADFDGVSVVGRRPRSPPPPPPPPSSSSSSSLVDNLVIDARESDGDDAAGTPNVPVTDGDGGDGSNRRTERDEPSPPMPQPDDPHRQHHPDAGNGNRQQQGDDRVPDGLNVSERIVTTKYGQLRGFVRAVEAGIAYASHFKETKVLGFVETFLGIPYASPPVRLMPPKGPTPWSGVRIFARPGPVCPQIPPLTTSSSSSGGGSPPPPEDGAPRSRASRSHPEPSSSSASDGDYDEEDEDHGHYGGGGGHQQQQQQQHGQSQQPAGSSRGSSTDESSSAAADDSPFLARMPRGRLKQLRRLLPLLREESEDCLRLNVYVPLSDPHGRNDGHATSAGEGGSGNGNRQGAGQQQQQQQRLPVLVFVHGESYSFGTGNAFDGSVLALQAKAVVVTFNYRLGPLGFLRIPAPRGGGGGATSSSGPYMTNYGLTDQLAALVWIHDNILGFGGDPGQVTVMGHGTGSALLHFVMISPQLHPSVPLFHRAILLGGSAYAPWSLIENMEASSMKLARMLNCTARHWGAGAGDPSAASYGAASSSSSSLPASSIMGAAGPPQSPLSASSSSGGSHQMAYHPHDDLYIRDNHLHGGQQYDDYPASGLPPSRGSLGVGGAVEYPPPLQQPAGPQMQAHFRQHQYHQPRVLSEAEADGIWRCLRNTGLKEFMQAAAALSRETPTFRHSFGPHVDHVSVLSPPFEGTAHRLADFDVLAGMTTAEAVPLFADVDVTVGIEMPKRNRIFRTLIRNSFTYHLNEILATVANEYTDWKSPHQRPAIIREAAVQAVSDALFAAPMVKTADVHSQIVEKNRFYLFAFNFASRNSEYPQRLGTAHGEELPYIFGVPLVDYSSYLFAGNISRDELLVSLAIMKVLGNFIHSGNPNHPVTLEEVFQGKQDRSKNRLLKWEPYDNEFQRYLLFDTKPKMKSHYRIHQLSLWLHLVPALNQPGVGVPNSHHLLDEYGNDDSYDGLVRTLVFTKPTSSTTATTVPTGFAVPVNNNNNGGQQQGSVAASGPGGKSSASSSAAASASADGGGGGDDVRPTDAHIYTTALPVTIGIGLSLLLINILIFAGVYYQTRRRSLTSSSSASGPGPPLQTPSSGTAGEHQQMQMQPIPDVTAAAAGVGNGGAKLHHHQHHAQQQMLKENGSLPTAAASFQQQQSAVSIGVETDLQKSYMIQSMQQNFGGTAVAVGQRRSPASGTGNASRCLVAGGGGASAALPYPPSEFADLPPTISYQQQEILLGGGVQQQQQQQRAGRPFGGGTLPRDLGRTRCVEFQTPPSSSDGGGSGDYPPAAAAAGRDPRLTQTLDKRVKIGGVTTAGGGILHNLQHQQTPKGGAASAGAAGGGGGGPVCSCETDPLLLQSIHLVTHSGGQHLLSQQPQPHGKNMASGYKDVRV